MTAQIKQPSFAGGEISPALYARSDNAIYERSLSTLRNMVTMRQGGITGRPGTQYIGTTLNGGAPVRLIPFIFNQTGLGQSYMLEFGNQYIAVYQDGGNVIKFQFSPGSILSITNANPGVLTIAADLAALGFINGSVIHLTDIAGMPFVDNQTFRMRNIVHIPAVHDTFTLEDLAGNAVDTTLLGTYTGGGTMALYLTVVSPYLQADLADMNYGQSADILTIVNQNYAPRELQRQSATIWILAAATYIGTAPTVAGLATGGGTVSASVTNYIVTAVMPNGDESVVNTITNNTVVPSVANPIIVTWLSAGGGATYRVYKFDVGGAGATLSNVFGFIGATSDVQFSDPGIDADYSDSPPLTGSLKAAVALGDYPAVVGYAQQRRFFANTPANPIGAWGSASGSPTNYNVNVNPIDSDAISFAIAGEEVNAIQALVELKFMSMFTSGAELYLQGNGSGVITPSAINASVQSQYGCSALRPLKIGDLLVFNQALGSAVRDFAFDFAVDGYRGNDITIFATHLFEGYQLVDWAYQRIPDSLIWAVRSDGVLLCCTYVREQQVLAWSRHDFDNGAAGNRDNLPAVVENVCSIPENGEYAVYLSIKRNVINPFTGNASEVRYIERLSSRIWKGPAAAVAAGTANAVGDPIDAAYLDCFAKFDGRNTDPTLVMNLSAASSLFVSAGINDTITFREPSVDNTVTLVATIPAGNYTAATLATAVGVALNAVGHHVYTVSLDVGKIRIDYTPIAGTLFLDFSAAQSAGVLLGFGTATYSIGGGSITAPIIPVSGFSTGDSAYQQKLTLTASASYFGLTGNAQVGDQIFLQDSVWISSQGSDGNQLRCTIQSITNDTTAIITPEGEVPSVFQALNIAIWARAVNQVTGLQYLSGQYVSIWADRYVVATPLNRSLPVYSVPAATGQLEIDLPTYYAVIFVGLPMTQDIQTLDREAAAGESLLASRKRSAILNIYLYNSRTLFAGSENPDTNEGNPFVGGIQNPLFELFELRTGISQATYDQPPPLLTDQDFVITDTRWNKNGRLFVRNIDPTPLTILSIGVGGESKSKNPAYERV